MIKNKLTERIKESASKTPIYKGNWRENEVYKKFSVVIYERNAYIAKVDEVPAGTLPTNNSYYDLYIDNSISQTLVDIDLSLYAKKEELPLVYFWDGKNSTSNPDNVQLFQELLDKYLKGKNILVVTTIIEAGSKSTFLYTFDKTKQYELTSNQSLTIASGNMYQEIKYTNKKIILDVKENMVNNVRIGSSYGSTNAFLGITSANNTYYFMPTKKGHPVSKGYLDDIIGNINSILDAINGEVVGDEAVTLQDEIPIENDTNIDNEYEEIIEDGINYINNENEEVIEDVNE